MDKKLIGLIDKAVSRRGFLAGSGSVAAATILAGCGGALPHSHPNPRTNPYSVTSTPTI